MTPFRLLLRNLLYHWRGNLAVFLGVVVGTAVLTGALLVGDSLRGSLRDLTLRRLGWVDEALVGGRFFREEAGRRTAGAGVISPAVLVRGTASVGRGRPAGAAGQRRRRDERLLGAGGRRRRRRLLADRPKRGRSEQGAGRRAWTPGRATR